MAPALAAAVVLLVAAARPVLAGGVIEGTVALPPAASTPAPTPRYPAAASHTVGAPDPPAAVVYLGGSFPAGAPGEVRVAQQHYQFAPGLLAVRRGTVIAFPNLDDEYHSVFSYSKARRFDLGRYEKDEEPVALVFDQAGVVKLFCEIHDHMRGTILVLDTPYFAKTDAAGRYRLENIPPGRFVLRAWTDDERVREQPVDVRDGQTLRVDFPAS